MGTVSGPFRPPQWQAGLSITTVMLIFPGQPTQGQYSAQGITPTLPQTQTRYIFDAVLRTNHSQKITKTRQPIQSGANSSDHAYVEPATVVLDIGMSDAMDQYTKGMWSGAATKSISAYQTIVAMAFARVPLVLATRLRTYSNMLITDIDADDTVKTAYGLRMRVTFEELQIAQTQTVDDSARPQVTNATGLGNVTPVPVTATQQSQYNAIDGTNPQTPVNAPGVSPWSSVNTNNLK